MARSLRGQRKDPRFYEIVDQTLASGFEHHYLILRDDTGRVRGVQPLFFVQQNLVEGVPALFGAVHFLRRLFPRFLTHARAHGRQRRGRWPPGK